MPAYITVEFAGPQEDCTDQQLVTAVVDLLRQHGQLSSLQEEDNVEPQMIEVVSLSPDQMVRVMELYDEGRLNLESVPGR